MRRLGMREDISSRSKTSNPTVRIRQTSQLADRLRAPTAPRPPLCAPISCVFTSYQWPMCKCALRRIGLAETVLAEATCGTIRLKLLKIGALVRVSVRRIKIAIASACPAADEWGLA